MLNMGAAVVVGGSVVVGGIVVVVVAGGPVVVTGGEVVVVVVVVGGPKRGNRTTMGTTSAARSAHTRAMPKKHPTVTKGTAPRRLLRKRRSLRVPFCLSMSLSHEEATNQETCATYL